MQNRLFLLCCVVFNHEVEEADRAVLHLINETLDQAEDVVVEYLKNNSDDQTEEGCQKSNFDTTSNDSCRDITYLLDLIERLDHTDNGTQESQRWSDRDEQ